MQTMSYRFASRPFISRHPAQPNPKTTTLGLSQGLVGPSPAGSFCSASPWLLVLKWEREVNNKLVVPAVFLDFTADDEFLIRLVNRNMVALLRRRSILFRRKIKRLAADVWRNAGKVESFDFHNVADVAVYKCHVELSRYFSFFLETESFCWASK